MNFKINQRMNQLIKSIPKKFSHLTELKCLICKTPFYVGKVPKRNNYNLRQNQRQRGCLTCSKKCSGIYYDITRQVCMPLYKKIAQQTKEIDQLNKQIVKLNKCKKV